jgi:hypothetical protein
MIGTEPINLSGPHYVKIVQVMFTAAVQFDRAIHHTRINKCGRLNGSFDNETIYIALPVHFIELNMCHFVIIFSSV